MFTGIIEETGCIKSVSQNGASLELAIICSFCGELNLGDSVCVNGICLTATAIYENYFCADVTPETFRRTSLYELKENSTVNLERAMKADGRFGGHIVSGHIDGTGIITNFEAEGNAINVYVSVSADLGKYIIEKGSVAIDGISLTVCKVFYDSEATVFYVSVIPHTWENTSLSQKKTVNIECDVIGKYVEHFVNLNKPQNEAYSEAMINFKSFH